MLAALLALWTKRSSVPIGAKGSALGNPSKPLWS